MQRRNLTETDTESGTLSYSNPQTVYNRLSGTITWLPEVGQVIKPGQTLYKVDGEPVMLMNGDTPGLPGPDPADQRRPRRRCSSTATWSRWASTPTGSPSTTSGSRRTTVGVEQFQESLGEAETGSLSLGQIVFLPGDRS